MGALKISLRTKLLGNLGRYINILHEHIHTIDLSVLKHEEYFTSLQKKGGGESVTPVTISPSPPSHVGQIRLSIPPLLNT